MLMDGARSAEVGGPLIDLFPSAAPAVSPAGLGKPTVIFTYAGPRDGQLEIDAPRVLTAALASLGIVGEGGSVGGPIVGILEWGSGNSAQFAAEFDVPTLFGQAASSIDNMMAGSGVIVSAPGDYLRCSLRNDANLVPRNVPGEQPIGDQSINVRGMACVGVGNRPGSSTVPLTRYAALNAGATPVAVNGTVQLAVPPFARSLQVFRAGAASASSLSVTMGAAVFSLDGPIIVAASAPSPSIPIPSGALVATIKNLGPDPLKVIGGIWAIGL